MKSRFKSKQSKKTHRTLSELDFIDLWGPGHNKQPDGEMSQNKFIDQVLIKVTTWGLAHSKN